MKQSNVRVFTALTLSAAVLAGCGGIGKMSKNADQISYTIDPKPLIVRGDSVALNIQGNFPPKYFSKKASLEATPVLTYSAGETPYKTVYYQGEDAAGNGTVIPYEEGRDITYNDKIAYSSDMKNSELMLRIMGRQGNKEKQFDPMMLAQGVITTPYLMMNDDKVLFAQDEFERVTQHKLNAIIHYLVNSPVVRNSELRDDDIEAMEAFLKEYGENEDYEFKSVDIEAYASPEGEISFNENLADERAASAQKTVERYMRRNDVTAYEEDNVSFNLMPKGEDWEGFKEAMEKSDIEDKDLILRILQMYEDRKKREEEIRNLAATYTEIADKILPDLRRSQIDVNYDIMGKSDEEILQLSTESTSTDTAGKTVHALNLEELLYAAAMTEDLDQKHAVYEKAAEVYPNDYRAFNNMGAISMMKNDMAAAEEMFQKANQLQENPVTTNNLGIIDRLNGDREAALEKFNAAMDAGNEVKYNKALVQIQNGHYDDAISNMQGFQTFNKALAQVLSGDASSAASTLSNAPSKDTAMGHYLNAIIGARNNNSDQVNNSLEMAYQKDPSLEEKAAEDLEFRDYLGGSEEEGME